MTNISTRSGIELRITSTYRSRNHPIEKQKTKEGDHSKGLAIDFSGVYINSVLIDHETFQRSPRYSLFIERLVEAGLLYINEGNHSHIAKTPLAKQKLYMAIKSSNGLIYSLGRNRARYFKKVTREHPDYFIAKEIISRSRK